MRQHGTVIDTSMNGPYENPKTVDIEPQVSAGQNEIDVNRKSDKKSTDIAATPIQDNVFVTVVASIQYRALAEKAQDAFYRLSNTRSQIQAYVFDVIRSSVPKLNLDDAFEQKNDIARAVEDELEKAMSHYGYEIVQTLIVDIEPDQCVKGAMNEINAGKYQCCLTTARLRVAANEKAEADKILQIKQAEGDAESKYLAGLGIARQRQAIVDGLRESVLAFSANVRGTTAKDVMDMVLVTQYFDTMKEIVREREREEKGLLICLLKRAFYIKVHHGSASLLLQLAGHLSLRLQQLDVKCETKTKDNVFVNVVASVQYRALADKANDAFYKLSNTRSQIQAYVFDVIRASVPKLNLDDAFEQKNQIAKAVEDELEKAMSAYGFEIVQTLIVDIEPDEHVKRAMNEINAAARLRVAATEKAEAEKILQIKRAEGEAESKYLSGLGIARQRQAIVDGLRDSVLGFSVNVPGTTAKDVMDMVLVTQYFDTMKEIGAASKSSAVFIPHGPGAVRDVATQIREGLLQASTCHP
ncbi:hypothetical protein AAC387_Pa08g1085 [Persea americana]